MRKTVFMPVQLSDFETKLLNRIIPTQTLSDAKSTQIALRNFIADDKEAIIAEQKISDADFRTLQTQSVKNIFQYLKENDFVGEREGGVNFLTEKGKNLRKQGSLEKYEVWRQQTRAENKVILNTIETRGYLDQDEINRNRRSVMIQRIKKFVVYPLLIIILLVVLVLGAHYYKLDAKVPVIKDFLDKHEMVTEKGDKDSDDDKADKEEPKKKKHRE